MLSPKAPKIHWITSSFFFRLTLITQFFDVWLVGCQTQFDLHFNQGRRKKNATTEFKLSPKAPKVHWINSSFFKLILMTQFFDVLIL